jgi:transposase
LPAEAAHQLRQRHTHLQVLKVGAQALENRLHALSYDPRACPKVQASLQTLLVGYGAEIARFEDELDTFSDEQLQAIARQMQTVKGIGPVSATALTALTDGLRHIESAKALACLVGVAPDRHQSGTSVYRPGRMLRTGRGYLRGLLYMAARSARRHNRTCRDLYERLRRRGKCHKVAMIAVVNKLLRQVFAVVKTGVPFDDQFAQAKLSLA